MTNHNLRLDRNVRPEPYRSMDLHLLASLAVTLGRWWCKFDDDRMAALADLATDVKPDVGLCGMTPGNRAMLRCFDDQALAKRFLKLPGLVVDEYRHRAGFTDGELRRLRGAAMCAVQSAVAVRPKNTSSTIIGRHVLERDGKIIVYYPACEVKNNVDLEFVLDDHTADILRFYIAKVRPLLTKADDPHLWPAAEGGPMSAAGVGECLGKFTERELGIRVTAHRFRHVCGYLYLLSNPNGIEVVRLLLGHKKSSTTSTYYASLEMREAHKRYDTFIASAREALPASPKSKKERKHG